MYQFAMLVLVIYDSPYLTASTPPFRLAESACVDSQVRAETNDAASGSRGRVCQTEPQTRKRTRYREPTLPSPHTLARRRFRLAGNCPAVSIMQSYRQRQAFSVWRDIIWFHFIQLIHGTYSNILPVERFEAVTNEN